MEARGLEQTFPEHVDLFTPFRRRPLGHYHNFDITEEAI